MSADKFFNSSTPTKKFETDAVEIRVWTMALQHIADNFPAKGDVGQ
jgi:hypothetical protein